jgi:hypothetical protein
MYVTYIAGVEHDVVVSHDVGRVASVFVCSLAAVTLPVAL